MTRCSSQQHVFYCLPQYAQNLQVLYILRIYLSHTLHGRSQWSRGVKGVGPRLFACWGCGFESRRWHGRLSLVSVFCCKVEFSASGWSLVQRSPTESVVFECDSEASIMRRPWGLLRHWKKNTLHIPCFTCAWDYEQKWCAAVLYTAYEAWKHLCQWYLV